MDGSMYDMTRISCFRGYSSLSKWHRLVASVGIHKNRLNQKGNIHLAKTSIFVTNYRRLAAPDKKKM